MQVVQEGQSLVTSDDSSDAFQELTTRGSRPFHHRKLSPTEIDDFFHGKFPGSGYHHRILQMFEREVGHEIVARVGVRALRPSWRERPFPLVVFPERYPLLASQFECEVRSSFLGSCIVKYPSPERLNFLFERYVARTGKEEVIPLLEESATGEEASYLDGAVSLGRGSRIASRNGSIHAHDFQFHVWDEVIARTQAPQLYSPVRELVSDLMEIRAFFHRENDVEGTHVTERFINELSVRLDGMVSELTLVGTFPALRREGQLKKIIQRVQIPPSQISEILDYDRVSRSDAKLQFRKLLPSDSYTLSKTAIETINFSLLRFFQFDAMD